MRLEVTAVLLNHISDTRDGIVGVFQRYEWRTEKGAVCNCWAAYLLAATAGERPAEKIVSVRRERRKG